MPLKIGSNNVTTIKVGTPLDPIDAKKVYQGTTPIWAKMTVYFDENTGSSVNNKTVYYKRAYGTLPTTSKTGHTFNGWFTDETWGTEVTEETICNQVDDHTLYAKLDINYYTVTWKDWDGTTLKTQTVNYGGNGTPPSQPTRTGYTFSGWSGTYTNVTSNRTITATYNINTYQVLFKDWDGTILKAQFVAYGGNATPPSNPTRTGYTFNSWSGDYTNVTSNRTITATYTINYYTVTFKDWDGTTLKTQTVNYGGNATPPTQPTRTGYTFSGWSGTYTNVTSNRTITATYTINKYTVTFKDWNGTTLKTQTVNYGSNATPPSNPTRTGYTFSGWSGTYTNVTSNRTITATYTINKYTVTFKDWNGTTLKTQTVNYGSNATPPSNPTRTGYTFSGWSGTYTNVTSNRTITATYTAVMAEMWKQTSNTNFTTELELYSNPNYYRSYQGCATPSYLLSQLNSSRPATSEAVGTIIRVRNSFSLSGQVAWCPTWMYYEAVIEPTKQWVYITYDSSEPSYQYYAYANINTTEEDWVEALEYEFPARDLAVGTMGYVIVQGDTIFPILQVQEV